MVHPKAYALVVADITAPSQLPWSSIQRLKSQGHESVDLYMLFPLAMGLNRMLGYDVVTAAALDAFYGTEEWRPIYDARRTDRQSAEMRRQMLDLYIRRLRTVGRWKHAFEVRDVKRTGNAGLYRMLFASNDPAGERLGRWAVESHRPPSGQGDLF
jgi:three-Cys-motif partner protein